jgi:hypothetical protein
LSKREPWIVCSALEEEEEEEEEDEEERKRRRNKTHTQDLCKHGC